MYYISDQQMIAIEQLKKDGKYDEALSIVNGILAKDPTNEEALLQIADIHYMNGDIAKSEKPVDFLLKYKGENDPMGLYVKGVLEMEKTNWQQAKKILRKSLELSNFENPEITRCYGLCEYWSGNREKGIDFLKRAFEINKYDAEIIYNLIEINVLEHRLEDAQRYIAHYRKYHSKIETFGNSIEYYDAKVSLIEQYLN